MSRHRFVRNLDLDEELNDEEEETGMSTEEAAQMNTALPIARSLLKDLKPPISDDAIADSLWHYWFDVEKTVGWIRQDREKKGEAPPADLVPTPDQQPRKRRRGPLAGPSTDPSLQPPLTALQRLSLSRKQSSPAPHQPSSTTSTNAPAESPSKPMSKLALLAQKRKEAAQGQQPTASSSQTNTRAATPLTAALGTSTPVAEPAKPLSKLAQKMAAARAAREQAAAEVESPPASADSPMDVDAGQNRMAPADDGTSGLFPAYQATSPPKVTVPSTFFSIITSTTSHDPAVDGEHPDLVPTGASLHVPLATDLVALTKRFEEAFAESPDEVVLRKRQGRAGTADLAAAVKKQKGSELKST